MNRSDLETSINFLNTYLNTNALIDVDQENCNN